jgi:multicomponent K+:H+ antiporter subunit A
VILPLSMIVAITHLLFGHDQPGDGFSAGVIVSLAVGLWYVVLGYHETKRQLPWLRSLNLIGIGLLLVMINATMTAIVTGPLFTHVDYGALLGISLPAGMHLTSSFLFDVAIFLTVLGGATLLIDTLGRPKDSDLESARKIDEITAMETVGKVTREETLNIPFKVR